MDNEKKFICFKCDKYLIKEKETILNHIKNCHKHTHPLLISHFLGMLGIQDQLINESLKLITTKKAYKQCEIDFSIFEIQYKIHSIRHQLISLNSLKSLIDFKKFKYDSILYLEGLKQNCKERKYNSILNQSNILIRNIKKLQYQSFNCPFCNLAFLSTYKVKHLLNDHSNKLTINTILSLNILTYDEKNEVYNSLHSVSKTKKIHIKLKYYPIKEIVKSFYSKNGKFGYCNENAKTELITSLTNQKFYTNEEINDDLEKKYKEMILLKVNAFLELPDKTIFVKEHCSRIYFTWYDVIFGIRALTILRKNESSIILPMPESYKILNEIKVEYFQRLYGKEIYKLIFHKNSLREDLSPDIELLKKILHSEYQRKTMKTKFKQNENNHFRENVSKIKLNQILKNVSSKNAYLKISASLMNDLDEVWAIAEDNNSHKEECLLFIYKRLNRVYFLWENINQLRSAYLFVINKNNKDKFLYEMINIIEKSIEYKREQLHKGLNIKNWFDTDILNFFSIIHDTHIEYSTFLKYQINNNNID